MDFQQSNVDGAIETFENPVIWEDLPDLDVIRVDDTFYYSASTFAFSPGAPLLRSYDLVNWEYVGHSVSELVFGPEYYLDGTKPGAYVLGIWASTINYRKISGTFYWYGAIQGSGKTYIFTAKQPEGPWFAQKPIEKLYYDCGLFIDDDDSMYIAYGSQTITVARLTDSGLDEVENKDVFTAHDPIEGARMYKINGCYYIWVTKPGDEQRVLKSTDGPFGPYECRQVLVRMQSPVPGSASPHQGSLVDTPDGRWWYMAFIDAYPGGRIPVLAPIKFDRDNWPSIVCDQDSLNGSWRAKYPLPVPNNTKAMTPIGPYKDDFAAVSRLSPRWEWNHNPINSKWHLSARGLTLNTACVADCLFYAANTLTHRILGPRSQATFHLDVSGMIDGDRAGAGVFRDQIAYIGLHKDDGITQLAYVSDISLDSSWQIAAKGTVQRQMAIFEDQVWLRVKAHIRPAFQGESRHETRHATFEYSNDGRNFTQYGPEYALRNTWEWYLGYRFAVFNFSTKELGGKIVVKSFELAR